MGEVWCGRMGGEGAAAAHVGGSGDKQLLLCCSSPPCAAWQAKEVGGAGPLLLQEGKQQQQPVGAHLEHGAVLHVFVVRAVAVPQVVVVPALDSQSEEQQLRGGLGWGAKACTKHNDQTSTARRSGGGDPMQWRAGRGGAAAPHYSTHARTTS